MKPAGRVNQNVIPIRPTKDRYHRVRITANPNDSRSVDVVESLLSKCELARCESSTEDGVSVWSMIVPKELLDEALEGIAVTVPVEYELFKDDEGRLCLVTSKEWFRLGGIAEETATCWEGDDLDNFESEVTDALKILIQAEMETLPWPGDSIGDEIIGKVEDTVLEQVDFLTASEEEIHDAVWEMYRNLLEGKKAKEDSE